MAFAECVYCGEQRELTDDHVPPRCLFSKPRPGNLITVPACGPCNAGFMKEDEYFRLAVTTGIDKEEFPKEVADSVRAINSLIRPASQGFARLMLQNYKPNPGRLKYDAQRIEVSLYRITRDLFYHHNVIRMPGTISFEFCGIDENTKLHAEGRARLDRLAGNLSTIGPGTFRYAFEPFDPPDPFDSAWLMRFYDHKTFFCMTSSE